MAIEHMKFVRRNTLKLAGAIDKEKTLIVPEGFKNNILWNLGHIYVVHENLIVKNSGNEGIYPDGFVENFKPGTRPSEWGESVPSYSTVATHLDEQLNRISELFEGRESDKIPEPISLPNFDLATVSDLMTFAAIHEAMHTTTVKLYNQLLNA